MSEVHRVAVIGAGVGGLAAVKYCLEESFSVVCYESRSGIGGLWSNADTDKSGLVNVTRTTLLNTTKESTSYSDLLMPAEFPNYLHNTKFHEYLGMYADHFGLTQYILFETTVVSVSPLSGQPGRWTVTAKNIRTGQTTDEDYDAVMVCTGQHNEVNMPKFDGQEGFKGRLIHAIDYKNTDGYEGKRVLVVGVGNTACDAAVDLSNVCKQVYLSVRNGAWFVRRVWHNGLPLDLALFTRFANFLVYFLPSAVLCAGFRQQVNAIFDHTLYGLRPNFEITEASAVSNDDLPCRILSGTVEVRPEVCRLTSSGAELSDGTRVDDVDVIICATGYNFNYSFIEHDTVKKISADNVLLYKYMFMPDIQPATLAFIGCAHPIGPHPPLLEMQCRFAVKVFKKEIQLPDSKRMWADVRRMKVMSEARFVPSLRRYILVDYITYMDDLADIIGCRPPSFFRLLATDPRLAIAVYFGLVTPAQYRLIGTGAWPQARQAILETNQRILQPLSTRRVTMATTSRDCNARNYRMLLSSAVVGAILVTFYYRRDNWQFFSDKFNRLLNCVHMS